MQIRQLDLKFQTPAFLGDAEQSGRWRTPPFKAQLRQWWRVAYAAQHQYRVNVKAMREVEGRLFGHAWLENDSFEREGKRIETAARKGQVRLRLNRWDEGKLKSWDKLEVGTVFHPEAEKVRYQVGPHAYLGFGPLDGRGGTQMQSKHGKANAAIQAAENAQLALAYPRTEAALIETALRLMHGLGTVGGRSRNGWGSYSLTDATSASPLALVAPTRPWADCLQLDWPHALGADSTGPLIWQTAPHKDWAGLMKTLAQIKIALRTQFIFKQGHTQTPEDRHWLSYPVTNHSVKSWGGNARLPNQLRFKVRPMPDGQLVGVIFHMPHKPPAEFGSSHPTLVRIWGQVHSHLDQKPAQPLTRIAA